ncbi:MAG: AAA family ATPase [Candidatus Pacearchaeota archaeon]
MLKTKEDLEKELIEKFEKLIKKRNALQEEINHKNLQILEIRQCIEKFDNELNNSKIEKARIDAEIENLEFEFKEFQGIELIQASLETLQEKLEKAQLLLNEITNVNLRALEVYDSVKKEYDEVAKKVEQLSKEKEEILKIIEEIDKKKRKTFLKTLQEINTLFSENFQMLSTKGKAYLELENPDEPFTGGLDIVIKIAKGKYFDVTSLSGGEQTIVALSLLFAIQKYRPYSFYIFDEIDAALDKRNSERLAGLLKQYINNGQYIMITHNDSLISSANVLYGVSMQDGVSKLISIEL